MGLGIRISDWEDLKNSIAIEENAIADITKELESGVNTLEKANEIKDKYRLKVNFLKDLKLETRVMTTYLQILQDNFEQNRKNPKNKPLLDFIVLSSLVKYVEELIVRLNTSKESLKLQILSLEDGAKFIIDMYNEVKRHLEFNVFGLDLNAVTETPPSTNF